MQKTSALRSFGSMILSAIIAVGCSLVTVPARASGGVGFIYETTDANGVSEFSTEKFLHARQIIRFNVDSSSTTVPTPVRPRHGADSDTAMFLLSACQRHSVPVALAFAIASVESNFDVTARSPKGASGVMQLLPDARSLDTGQLSPQENIELGVELLSQLLRRYHGNVTLAAAAYNAGSGTVSRFGDRIPPYPETMLYVSSVLDRMREFSEQSP